MKLDKNKEYVLQTGRNVHDFEVYYDTERSFCHSTESDSEVIVTYDNFINHKHQILSIAQENSIKSNLQSCFFKLMECMPIHLYNDDEYLEKYPTGFFTENRLMIPVNVYQNIERNTEQPYNTVFLFIHLFSNILEKQYNIQFSNEDYIEIYKSFTSQIPQANIVSPSFTEYLETIKPDFVPEKDLLDEAKNKNFSQRTIDFFSMSKNDNLDYLDSIVFNSLEANNPNHPFNILKNKVKQQRLTFNEDEKNELISKKDAKYKMFYNPVFMLKTLSFIEDRIEHYETNLTLQNSNKTIEDLSDDLKPFLFDMTDIQFTGIICLCRTLIEKKLSSSHRKVLANSINSDPNCGPNFRNCLINAVTSYTSVSNASAKIMEKSFYNALTLFKKSCEEGDIPTIEKVLLDYPEFINNEESIGIAFNKVQVKVLDYFLTHTDKNVLNEAFKNKIRFSNNDILELLLNSKSINQLEHYQEFLDASVTNNNKEKLEYLLSLDTDNSLDSIKSKALYSACYPEKYNLEIIKTIADNLSKNPTDEKIKEDVFENIKNSCGMAAEQSKEDILRYFIFEYQMKFSDDLSIDFPKESKAYIPIKNMLELKKLNEELNVDLNANTPLAPKKAKL